MPPDKPLMIQKIGNRLIDGFHYIALFGISTTIVWSAVHDYIAMMKSGHATLEDILLLFIYLELGAMVSTYFKTHRLPVQFVIYIAITALSRHLVIDVQKVADNFHLYLLITITLAIAILSLSISNSEYSAKNDWNLGVFYLGCKISSPFILRSCANIHLQF